MACPVCGNPSPCPHEQQRTNTCVDAGFCNSQQSSAHATAPSSGRSAASAAASEVREHAATEPWRREVVSRVRQHRARRHKRFHPNATMELDFPAAADSGATSGIEESVVTNARVASSRQEPPKIIEFPRPATNAYFPPALPEPEEDQLAEPVLDAPRILDAPEPPAEQMNLLPAFADIELKAQESSPSELELPPQTAPLLHRTVAGAVDMAVVLAGAGFFLIGVGMFASGMPQLRFLFLCALLVCGSLWFIYQYLFLVYSASTPGMLFAQLELCTFQGTPVSLSVRRWRALASVLSAFALGLGFAWAFVDEDQLGWHDRMTQTHLRKSAIST